MRGRNDDGKRDGSSGAGGLPSIPLVHVQRTGAEEIHPVSPCLQLTVTAKRVDVNTHKVGLLIYCPKERNASLARLTS